MKISRQRREIWFKSTPQTSRISICVNHETFYFLMKTTHVSSNTAQLINQKPVTLFLFKKTECFRDKKNDANLNDVTDGLEPGVEPQVGVDGHGVEVFRTFEIFSKVSEKVERINQI